MCVFLLVSFFLSWLTAFTLSFFCHLLLALEGFLLMRLLPLSLALSLHGLADTVSSTHPPTPWGSTRQEAAARLSLLSLGRALFGLGCPQFRVRENGRLSVLDVTLLAWSRMRLWLRAAFDAGSAAPASLDCGCCFTLFQGWDA